MIGGGTLAIWNDCAPGREEIYERWYQDEQLRDCLKAVTLPYV
jgi:hypothetical protein